MQHTKQVIKKTAVILIGMVIVLVALYSGYALSISKRDVAFSFAEGGRIVGEISNDKIVYLASISNKDEHGGGPGMAGSDLMVRDIASGKEHLISRDIWTATISPDGTRVVTANADNKIHVYKTDGELVEKIGNNGSNPIFSNSGRYVVYHKLADVGDEFFDLVEQAKGIAMYDLVSESERMLTNQSGDDYPIGFSEDESYFYFSAGRPYEHSIFGEDFINITSGIYALDMKTGEVTRLTNTDEQYVMDNGQTASFIAHNALWTTNRDIAISVVDGQGVYKYVFDNKGGLTSVDRTGDGNIISWEEKNRRVKVRTVRGGKELVDIITIN